MKALLKTNLGLISTLFVVFTFSCTPQFAPVPNELIQPEMFTDIMVDIRLAEAQQKVFRQNGYYDEHLVDSSYQMIYASYNVSMDKVEKSYNFYVSHPNWMEKLSAEVIEKLNKMEE